jgi:hypothetical protein
MTTAGSLNSRTRQRIESVVSAEGDSEEQATQFQMQNLNGTECQNPNFKKF